MLWQIYLKNGTAYVPTVAETEAGFYVDVDPVKVIPALDSEALQRAIKETIARGNPRIPTPRPAAFLKSAVLKYANVNSWSEFEKDASCWKIVENGGKYRIVARARGACSGIVARDRDSCSWETSSEEEVAARVAALVQAASPPPLTEDQPILFPALPIQTNQPQPFELTEEAVVNP
jgi:hypothetical protein